MSETRRYCSFQLDGMTLGVDALDVQEIIRYQPMTRVPLADTAITGLINLRGQIVTAIDLRHCLGLAPRATGEPPMNVVLNTSEGVLSMLVDKIGDVVEVDDDQLHQAPETVAREVRALMRGALPMSDRLLLVLDTARLALAGAA